MEISRQRIGQSIYETLYTKCECCEGNGFKKTDSIIINNIISIIKGINAISNKDDIEVFIDKIFFDKNSKIIDKKIKSLKLSYKINFINKSLTKNIFEFNKDLMDKVRNNNRETIEKNKTEDLTINKSYRRKIKRKEVEN